MRFTIYTLFAILLIALFMPAEASAQRRDYLTEAEVELVSDAQEIDRRVDVLVKAIERRFLVLTGDQSQAKQIEKDAEKWGELPKGNRPQLLLDISRILQKAVDDIDDLARREGGMDSKLFPKAIHKLADSAQKFLPQFKAELDKVKDDKEKGSVLTAIDLCGQIIEASAKVAKEPTKEEKKKKKNSN